MSTAASCVYGVEVGVIGEGCMCLSFGTYNVSWGQETGLRSVSQKSVQLQCMCFPRAVQLWKTHSCTTVITDSLVGGNHVVCIACSAMPALVSYGLGTQVAGYQKSIVIEPCHGMQEHCGCHKHGLLQQQGVLETDTCVACNASSQSELSYGGNSNQACQASDSR